MNWLFPSVVGLALAQVLLYRIDSRQALRAFGFLGIFYFFLFALVQELKIFCTLFSISFYDLPLLSITLLFVFGREIRRFPRFARAVNSAPQFYLLTSLFMSLIWFKFLPSADSFVRVFLWSFFAALLIPLLSGIKERLLLSNAPDAFRGLPLFLLAAGLLLLGMIPWTFLINGRP